MPASFDRCVRAGGRVRTKTLPKQRYIRICWIRGKSHAGEVKKKKRASRRKQKRRRRSQRRQKRGPKR